jgi:hypothetical protein
MVKSDEFIGNQNLLLLLTHPQKSHSAEVSADHAQSLLQRSLT